jgi:hypothetical protein
MKHVNYPLDPSSAFTHTPALYYVNFDPINKARFIIKPASVEVELIISFPKTKIGSVYISASRGILIAGENLQELGMWAVHRPKMGIPRLFLNLSHGECGTGR